MAIEQIQHFLDHIIWIMGEHKNNIDERKEYDAVWRKRLKEISG